MTQSKGIRKTKVKGGERESTKNRPRRDKKVKRKRD
jgi:hypothetical protein